ELPVGGSNIRLPEPISPEPVPEVPKGTRALVVEDEAALGEAVASALTDDGFIVDRASDGSEALTRIRDRVYDVVICDLKMPKVDGIAFFQDVARTMPPMVKRVIC